MQISIGKFKCVVDYETANFIHIIHSYGRIIKTCSILIEWNTGWRCNKPRLITFWNTGASTCQWSSTLLILKYLIGCLFTQLSTLVRFWEKSKIRLRTLTWPLNRFLWELVNFDVLQHCWLHKLLRLLFIPVRWNRGHIKYHVRTSVCVSAPSVCLCVCVQR